MKKQMLVSVFLVTSLVFVSSVFATPLTSLSIINDNTPGYRWDTDPSMQWSSPIGVATSLSDPIVQAGTGSKSIDGLVEISPGQSVYLFTESFPSFPGLFQDQPYTLTVSTPTYALQFSFVGTYAVFCPPAPTTPFELEFLGFTGSGALANVSDQVSPAVSASNQGLQSDGSPDAVYQLKYIPPTAPLTATTAVPEPTTLFLLNVGLVGILGLGRRLKK